MFFVKKKKFILKTKLLLWWWCPFLEDSGRTFGLINSPWERVTRSHHGSQVSLFLSTFIFFHFPLLKLVQLWNAQILVTFVINFLYRLSIYQLNTLTFLQRSPLQHYNTTFLYPKFHSYVLANQLYCRCKAFNLCFILAIDLHVVHKEQMIYFDVS